MFRKIPSSGKLPQRDVKEDFAWGERIRREKITAEVVGPEKWGWMLEPSRQMATLELSASQTSANESVTAGADNPDSATTAPTQLSVTLPERKSGEAGMSHVLSHDGDMSRYNPVSRDIGRRYTSQQALRNLDHRTQTQRSTTFINQMRWPKDYAA